MRNWIVIRSTIAVLIAERRSSPKTMLTTNREEVPRCRPERAADENLAHVAQHVIAHAARAGRVDVAIDDRAGRRARAWRGRTSAVKTQTSTMTQRMAGVEVLVDRRIRLGAAGIELHHAGGVGDRFDAGKREHDSDKAAPVLPESRRATVADVPNASPRCGRLKSSEHDDDDRGRHRNEKGEAAGVFRAEQD